MSDFCCILQLLAGRQKQGCPTHKLRRMPILGTWVNRRFSTFLIISAMVTTRDVQVIHQFGHTPVVLLQGFGQLRGFVAPRRSLGFLELLVGLPHPLEGRCGGSIYGPLDELYIESHRYLPSPRAFVGPSSLYQPPANFREFPFHALG